MQTLILHAPGTNRDGDLAYAIQSAGGNPVIKPLSQLRSGSTRWQDYGMLALPGGFSYGDALGAGKLWALDLQTWFADFLSAFVESGRPVVGICNGFQALLKAGLFFEASDIATLTFNESGRFECRWVSLSPSETNPSPWLTDLPQIFCPVAHGEGRFLLKDGESVPPEQLALRYANAAGEPAQVRYPANPNGSVADIAGITNQAGNVLGVMPHPEDHIHPFQHPRWTRGQKGGMGLKLFKNGLKFA